MKKVGRFEKVGYLQFHDSIRADDPGAYRFAEREIERIYEELKLPTRSSSKSAGYDFYSPFDFDLRPNESIIIPTGIKVHIKDGWFLGCFPRSGLGFKYSVMLSNTVGIIDGDYISTDNEGHIFCKLINRSIDNKQMPMRRGQGFMQGIFLPFGVTEDDEADGVRIGGLGSSDKK